LRIAYFVVLALLWASPCRADTGFLDRKVALNGQTYAYQVYVPADYTAVKTWPVIVNLHGNGAQEGECGRALHGDCWRRPFRRCG